MERFSLREFLSNSQTSSDVLPLAWPIWERVSQVAGSTGLVLTRVWAAAGNFLHGLPFVVAVHWILIALAAYLACWLRFDGDIPPHIVAIYLRTLPWVIVIRSLIFLPFGLYDGLWKYTGVWDLSRIVLAVLTSAVVLYAPIYSPLGP